MHRAEGTEKERIRGWTGWVAGGLLLLTAAALFVFVVPVAECPWCDLGRALRYASSDVDPQTRPLEGCDHCRHRGRISLWKYWKWPME
jgi:hypothetical protein